MTKRCAFCCLILFAALIGGGNMVVNQSAGGATLVASDNFDAYTNAASLDSLASWVGVNNDIFINKPASDGSVYGGGSQGAAYHTTSFNADHRSVVICKLLTGGSGNFISVQVRVQAGADTRYWFQTDGTDWYLVKRNAGSQSVISNGTLTISTGDKIRLDAAGSGSATRLTAAHYSGGSWTNISGATNVDPGGTYIDGGSPGVGTDSAASGNALLDDWEGYNL